jgi:hypothetical protein
VEMDGCPRFAPAYLGRKWFFRMLFRYSQQPHSFEERIDKPA